MKVWMVGWKRMPVECVNEMFSLIFNCKNRYVWEVKNEIKMFFLDEWRSECDFRKVKMPVFKKKDCTCINTNSTLFCSNELTNYLYLYSLRLRLYQIIKKCKMFKCLKCHPVCSHFQMFLCMKFSYVCMILGVLKLVRFKC